jgi:hypothetical protein
MQCALCQLSSDDDKVCLVTSLQEENQLKCLSVDFGCLPTLHLLRDSIAGK